MAGTSEERARLREYGMHIGQTLAGVFELYPESGKIVGKFPTWEDAYEAFEQAVDCFWEAHADGFYEVLRQRTQRKET